MDLSKIAWTLIAVGAVLFGIGYAYKEGVKHGYDQRSEAQARYDEGGKKVKQEIAIDAIRADVREIRKWIDEQIDLPPCDAHKLPDPLACKCKPGTCTCCQRCGGSGLPHKPCGCDGCKCCKGCDGDHKGCGCGCQEKCCKEAGCRCDGEHKDFSGCKCNACRRATKGGKK